MHNPPVHLVKQIDTTNSAAGQFIKIRCTCGYDTNTRRRDAAHAQWSLHIRTMIANNRRSA